VLYGHFGHSHDVKIILDRRESERRAPGPPFSGVDRRRGERRKAPPDLRKLGWSVIETDEPLVRSTGTIVLDGEMSQTEGRVPCSIAQASAQEPVAET
jgi:hypothetical protein